MKNKKVSFMDHLECYFNIYLPTVKGLSQSTIVSYKATFRILMEFLYTVKGIPSDMVEFSTLDDKLIMEFLNWLETERSCSVSTRNQRLSAIAAFSMYAQNRDFGSAVTFRNCVLKVPKKKVPRKGRSSFTRDEVKALFELPDSSNEIGLRDKTLLCFMYASGTRAQEVCDLTIGDIQFYSDRAGINIHGKDQKVRRIGIPCDASNMLKKYIVHRRIINDTERHVFSSQTHEKMSVSCIDVYVYCSNLDIQEFIPEGVKYLRRSESLDQDTTSMTGVLTCFTKEVPADVYVMTHTTAPFISKDSIEKGLSAVLSGKYDSSFAAKKLQDFLWKDDVPFNYQLDNIPRTQDLEPLYEETSGFYIYKKNVMSELHRRIGDSPFVVEVGQIERIDIDEMEDFIMADAIFNYRLQTGGRYFLLRSNYVVPSYIIDYRRCA